MASKKQGDFLNHLVNDVLGWKDYDATVYFTAKNWGDSDAEFKGWFLKSDDLDDEIYLGANHEEAMAYLLKNKETLRPCKQVSWWKRLFK